MQAGWRVDEQACDCAGFCDVFGNLSKVNHLSDEHDIIPALGGWRSVMEASACPRCARALKISVIEPHPTRDRVDVVTYRCPIHGDVWRSVVVNQVEAADTDRDAAATMT